MIGYVYALRLATEPVCYIIGSTAVPVRKRLSSYFDPARSHGHLANLVRRAGRERITVAHVRPVVYAPHDAKELERQERITAQRWRARGLVVYCDQLD